MGWDKLDKVLIVGFGSIGAGFLPLLLRHVNVARDRIVILDPAETNAAFARAEGIRFERTGLTPDDYRAILERHLDGFERCAIVNLSVDVSSAALIELSLERGWLYLDTVVEPWPGFYLSADRPAAEMTNYALRESVVALKGASRGRRTAVSCCGANPGMVSWLVKEAALQLARATGSAVATPASRAEWAALLMALGVKGIHIAEYDSQKTSAHRAEGEFLNTWSSDGFISEAFQPAEIGWGTSEGELPADGHRHQSGSCSAIYLGRFGHETTVRTWTPTFGAHAGYLVTHNEAISIADYFSARSGDELVYRPTCHYAYRPCDVAIASLREIVARARASDGFPQVRSRVLTEDEIHLGYDELGVLLYGHGKNAYWYGSRLSNDEARRLAPCQNATGLQVSSAVLAGLLWAMANPDRGIVEAEEMDFRFCLDIQTPYLGSVEGFYTDWTPLLGCDELGVPARPDPDNPWSIRNTLAVF